MRFDPPREPEDEFVLPDHLCVRGRDVRPGRPRPRGELGPADRSDAPQEGDGQLRRLGQDLVLEDAVSQDGHPASRHRAPGRPGRRGRLGTALGREWTLDHLEGRQRHRARSQLVEGYVQAQSMIGSPVHDPEPEIGGLAMWLIEAQLGAEPFIERGHQPVVCLLV
jgi:hypothetical protein